MWYLISLNVYNVGQVEWLGFPFYGYLRILYLLQVLGITKAYKRINWNIWCGKWSYMANNHLLGQIEIDHGNC